MLTSHSGYGEHHYAPGGPRQEPTGCSRRDPCALPPSLGRCQEPRRPERFDRPHQADRVLQGKHPIRSSLYVLVADTMLLACLGGDRLYARSQPLHRPLGGDCRALLRQRRRPGKEAPALPVAHQAVRHCSTQCLIENAEVKLGPSWRWSP